MLATMQNGQKQYIGMLNGYDVWKKEHFMTYNEQCENKNKNVIQCGQWDEFLQKGGFIARHAQTYHQYCQGNNSNVLKREIEYRDLDDAGNWQTVVHVTDQKIKTHCKKIKSFFKPISEKQVNNTITQTIKTIIY